MRSKSMENLHSVCCTWILSCLLALVPVHMSWAQAPLSPAIDSKLTKYAREIGTIAFLEKNKMGLSYCGTTYQDLAAKAAREKNAYDMRNKEYAALVETGRAEFYLLLAEAEGNSPRHIAEFWDSKTAKSQEQTLSDWKQGLLKDWTKCLAFIEAVQRSEYDIKNIFPEIHQSVMARKEPNSQKR
ncbi:hypothetical protein [Undibacterium pigrum]|uniref:Uncharacterized protein n=1 Tax=Undibacterium pigrum TaxID=401470 RepID=A0A318JME2_9BURK|nr:hypothetical protein [Undibacterium pigrum]PXX41422.1 hypothetical protein DFR42_10773 [Undibacterium pigrum]